jgi:hypothetical protein
LRGELVLCALLNSMYSHRVMPFTSTGVESRNDNT